MIWDILIAALIAAALSTDGQIVTSHEAPEPTIQHCEVIDRD